MLKHERSAGDEDIWEVALRHVRDYAIFLLDVDGRTCSWNAGVREVLGWEEADWLGRHLQELLPIEEDSGASALAEELAQARHYGQLHCDRWLRRRDGSAFFAVGVTTAIRDDRSALVGYLKIVRDRTALHVANREHQASLERERLARAAVEAAQREVLELNATLERRVQERTLELTAANDQLETFSYTVAHDMRAPLRAISAAVERIADSTGPASLNGHVPDSPPTGGATDELGRIRQAVHQANALIEALLKLSHVTRRPLKRSEVDLSALARAIAAELQSNAAKPIRFEIVEGLVAQADEALVRIVLENLLRNAVKFSADRNPPFVKVGSDREPDGTRAVFVRDNGVGFDMLHAHRLFTAFQRLHSAEQFAGTGIGLATVKRIVNLHGGQVRAVSRADEGATFYFTLQAPPVRRRSRG